MTVFDPQLVLELGDLLRNRKGPWEQDAVAILECLAAKGLLGEGALADE